MEKDKAVCDCGINCVGTGISVVNREMLAAEDYEGIERLAREHVAVVGKYISDKS